MTALQVPPDADGFTFDTIERAVADIKAGKAVKNKDVHISISKGVG